MVSDIYTVPGFLVSDVLRFRVVLVSDVIWLKVFWFRMLYGSGVFASPFFCLPACWLGRSRSTARFTGQVLFQAQREGLGFRV